MNPSLPWYKYNITITPEPPEPPAPAILYMSSSGTSFAPRLHLFDGYDATVTWSFSDGSTSSSLTPTVTFSSSAIREHTLTVDPPTAIHALNFGYDGGDDGTNYSDLATYQHTATSVHTVSNLLAGAPNLERFFASNTPISSVDFTNCDNLQVAEFYTSGISSVNLTGCHGLHRCCFELSNLSSLNVSDAEFIEDVRGRAQTTSVPFVVTFGNTSRMWHLCVGSQSNGISGFESILNGTKELPNMRQLWLWNGFISGVLTPRCTVTSLQAQVNLFTTFSTENITWVGDGVLNMSYNQQLTSINLTGSANGVAYVNFSNNYMSSTLVDYILGVFAGGTRSNGTIILNNNSIPGASGQAAVTTLRGRGWTVTVDT